MDLNASYKMSASFQVVPEQRYEVPQAYLDEIRERGFEVNVHDFNHDGALFLKKDEFIRRAAKINDYAKRFGALGFRSAVCTGTWSGSERLIFFTTCQFQICATGSAARWLLHRDAVLYWRPRRTTINDDTGLSLFHVLETYDMEIWERQIKSIIGHHGLLSFLIHPDYIIPSRALDTYRRLLERLSGCAVQHDCWLASPREVAQWWKRRRK